MPKNDIKSAVSLTDLPLDMLEAYRNTVVKSANQKARRLESWAKNYNAQNPKHPTGVLNYSYAKYARENKRLYKGSKRGAEKVHKAEKMTTDAQKKQYAEQLMHQIKVAEQFMQSETSSGTKYMSIGERRAKTIRERYGIDISPDDLYTFFESPQYQRWMEKYNYNSKQALVSIGNVQRDNDVSLQQFMKEFFQNRGKGRTLGVKSSKLKTPVSDKLPISQLKKR